MNYDRVVILLLLLILILTLWRLQPSAASEAAGQVPRRAAESAGESEANDVLSVIHSRKSVRAYTDDPVSREELEVLLRAGMAAPTAGNAQPWAFVAVTERPVLDALAEVLPHGKMLKKAPAAIAVCGVESLFRDGAGREMWVQDCSAATENILLAAEGTGLGAVWIGVYPDRNRGTGVRGVLQLPEEIIPLSVISIGRPTGVEQPKEKFKPERIHWQKW